MQSGIWFWGANVIGAVSVLAALAAIVVPSLRSRMFSKDYLAGLLFQGFGLLALWIGNSLALGTAVRMGPGYVPRLLGFVLLGLGAVISVQAAMVPSEGPDRGQWRPFILIPLCVLAFAIVFDFAGLIPAIVATIVVATAGGNDIKWGQTVFSLAFLLLLCVGVFKYALNLPMPLFELKV